MENSGYKEYIPEIGDYRYKKIKHKFALDIIRVKYYEKYGKDPSISWTDDRIMFYDPSLPIFGTCYFIRGIFPFKMYLQSTYENVLPNRNKTITFKVEKKHLTEENIAFLNELVRIFGSNEINLAFGDYIDREYTISYVADEEFKVEGKYNRWTYYGFFERLFRNNWRNIIYIGDSLKKFATDGEIEKVQKDFIERDKKLISKHLHRAEEYFEEQNQAVRSRFNKQND